MNKGEIVGKLVVIDAKPRRILEFPRIDLVLIEVNPRRSPEASLEVSRSNGCI
jgi:hypothetical protein